MEFPTYVYKGIGLHQRKGGTFAYADAPDQEAFDRLTADGWHATLDAAIAAHDNPTKADAVADTKIHEDNAPPTRDELKQKATELGIEFAPQTGDKKLTELIEAKLAEINAAKHNTDASE